jgi:signal transduction histidine kinase
LAQEGLVGALQQRLEAVEKRAGVQTQLEADTGLDLPGPLEEALYHIAQEALNNALKHAEATGVTVRIKTSNDRVELEVADNGKGFDPQATDHKGGLGLTNMRERAEKLGGTFTLQSAPGKGTIMKASLEIV